MTDAERHDDRHDDLLKLYPIAVEECRFQVQLNNQRFQWNVALDVALVTVGTGLLRLQGPGDGKLLTALLFCVGAVLAVTTGLTVSRQVEYQHRARDQALKIAAELGLSEYAVGSTLGWTPSTRRHWPPKARTLNYLLLLIIGVVNTVGAFYVLTR
jgi:drug/metabolite transporter (DMT)-like permease